jgi:hypothetical protein
MINYDYIKIKKDFLITNKNIIRIGSIDDGGYYITSETILKADMLFSGGISSNVEFEYDIFRFNKNIKIIMVDPTVSVLKLFFKGLLRFLFFKKNKVRYLFNTLIFKHLLDSGRCWHINKWLTSSKTILDVLNGNENFRNYKQIILKLDIEGSEFELLNEIKENLDFFSCMVFEFHNMDKNGQIVYEFIQNCSSKFDLISIDQNPSGGFYDFKRPKNIELTLIKK